MKDGLSIKENGLHSLHGLDSLWRCWGTTEDFLDRRVIGNTTLGTTKGLGRVVTQDRGKQSYEN